MRFGWSLFSEKQPVAAPVEISVQHAGQHFSVVVRRRPTARRFTLRVIGATGEIVLSMPERASFNAAFAFAQTQGGWIAARVAALPKRVPFNIGEWVPLRGVPHRILHWSKVPAATRASQTAEGEHVLAVSGDPAHLPRRVADFLKKQARADFEMAVALHTHSLGIPARKVSLRDTKSRWGSCSSRGCLNFSWRLILAPSFVLDYLAAHEVAHLQEMNHSHRFWAIVHRLCPRTEEAERWLKRHGATLHHYG